MRERMPGDRIELESRANVRDLGGYTAADGRRVRMHRLIRSESLYGITPEDIGILTGEYELRTIVDFRTGMEVAEKPDPVMPGVVCIHNPILNEAQMGMTHEGKTENRSLLDLLVELVQKDAAGPEQFMCDLYAQLVTQEETVARYRKFMEYVLKQEEGAILWHCSAGKDRAGMGAVFVLWALGVDEETIRRDYLLTNTYLKEELEQMLAGVAARGADPRVVEGLRVMNSALESYLDRLLETVREVYGSMDAFLEAGLGIGAAEKVLLCRNYLE